MPHSGYLMLLESLEVTPKNVSKPSKCLVIKSLVLSTPLRVLVLGLALEREREYKIKVLLLVSWFLSELTCISVRRPSLESWCRRHVFDPLAWCGAASTTLCKRRGDSILHREDS